MKHVAPGKKINIVFFLGILLVASLSTNLFLLFQKREPLPSSPTATVKQTVTSVIDGDTFDTQEGLRVRLALIDAPEYPKECFSQQSKKRLESLVLGKEIVIEELTKDNFGRTVAFALHNNLLINKAQVTEGYAQISNYSDETKYSHELSLAQTESQTAQRGIWSSTCQNEQKKDCIIKGNYRTDTKTKIYHLTGCFNYDKTSINTREKDQWFCTEEEAQKAGFVKSEDCP